MPSDFPNSPKLVKGAFVEYRSKFLGPIPNIIVFQYNPKELSRTLSLPTPEKGKTAKGREPFKIAYPPEESITLNIIIDATDQLEDGHPIAVTKGIYPTLSALELLLYPENFQVLSQEFLKTTSEEKVTPQEVPLVLFIWGPSRVLPVKITSFKIDEKEFDSMLNPIRAEVSVTLGVLTWYDLKENDFAKGAYMWTQSQKEMMARLNLIISAENAMGQFF